MSTRIMTGADHSKRGVARKAGTAAPDPDGGAIVRATGVAGPPVDAGGATAMNIAHVLARKGVKVITISPEHTVRQALAILAEHNIGALVVVDDRHHPVGILSERDIVREAARSETLFARRVAELMTRELIVGVAEDDLKVVLNTMTERRIRHLPVVEKGKLVGIVSIGDVVKAERDQYEGLVDTLQQQVIESNP
jgi:CBS domain-containing protein